MSLPVFEEIRKAFPSAHIIAATRANVADVFRACSAVNEIVVTPSTGTSFIDTYKDARKLRDRRISFGILLTNSFATALWMKFAGVKKRIGFSRDLRGILLSCPFKASPEILAAHQAEYFLYLLKGIGIDVGLNTLPVLRPSGEQKQEARALLKNIEVINPYAVIAPFSAFGEVKDWPVEHYRQTAEGLVNEFNLDVLITGTQAQANQCEGICGTNPRLHNVAGRTSLGGLFGLLDDASIFVGGDSGGAHLAAALGKPTVSIFGITEPSRTRALGPHVTIVGNGGLTTPNLRDPVVAAAARAALLAIPPEQILTEVGALLQLPSATPRI